MNTEQDTILTTEIVAEIERQAKTDYAYERRAVTLMLELSRARADIFLLMRDDGIAKWWAGKIESAKKSIAARRMKWQTYRVKMAAWDRLSATERKVLGLRKPISPSVEDPDKVSDSALQQVTTVV